MPEGSKHPYGCTYTYVHILVHIKLDITGYTPIKIDIGILFPYLVGFSTNLNCIYVERNIIMYTCNIVIMF